MEKEELYNFGGCIMEKYFLLRNRFLRRPHFLALVWK